MTDGLRRWSYVLPLEPIGKGRGRSGNGRVYTPEKTRDWEATAAAMLRTAFRGSVASVAGLGPLFGAQRGPLSGPIGIVIRAIFPRPKEKRGMPAADCWYVKKPDFDNVEKIVCDALKVAGVIEEDATICDSRCVKLMRGIEGQQPRVEIEVRMLDGESWPPRKGAGK